MDLFNKKKIKNLKAEMDEYKTTQKVIRKGLEDTITEKEKTISGLRLSLEQAETYIDEQKSSFGQTIVEKDNIIAHLNKKLEKVETSRRKSAAACGAYIVNTKKLKSQLVKATDLLKLANNKITWLSKRRGSPSFAEINAYDHQQKEVERRRIEKENESRKVNEEQLTIDTVKA